MNAVDHSCHLELAKCRVDAIKGPPNKGSSNAAPLYVASPDGALRRIKKVILLLLQDHCFFFTNILFRTSKKESPLSSELKAMKLSLANMVLKNANLSNEFYVCKRLLQHYELATSQDLMAIMSWIAEQLQRPVQTLQTKAVASGQFATVMHRVL